ncbi:beta-galactosidase [Thaumasiovibrio subtropicus]|uniref:beta-galactosidase n=1 Tax=Thaumasiovibrio subtropicus TaxID=1891207 RepID=UPI000B36070C|nr:beta-galactosidase [Thaumasiovibrio subtropicus]
MTQSSFLYGAGYYPMMHSREEWEHDLQLMHEAGIKLIRTAEIFNSWDRIEPEPGQYDFDFLDAFFDRCHAYGMKILLGTGTCSPPFWLTKEYPDVNLLSSSGKQYPNNVSYTWACPDHTGFRREAERYIQVLVNRYKDHPALGYYQIHNEISMPFMPVDGSDVALYCYCEHSVKAFQSWLKNKYVTLDALNHAYRWGATNTVHTTWEEIQPPKVKCTGWSSVTRWMDWRLFWMENLVNFIGWQHELIKTLDTEHPTTANIFFLKSQDPLGVLTALDQFEMSKVVDIIGYDLYPGSGDKLETTPEFASMFLDMARSTVRPLNRDYWLMETESGPINGWLLGPSRNVKGFDIERNITEAIAHDAKMTLFQGWREWEFQPLHWGAIVDLKGNPTSRTPSANWVGEHVNAKGAEIMDLTTGKGKVAILMSKENAIVANGVDQEAFLVKALRGAYRVLWEQQFNIDFVTPELVKSGYANDYQAILMPFMTVIDQPLSTALARYVEQGGLLVGSARCGMLGRNGWYNTDIPCHDLQSVFGIHAFDAYANVKPIVSFKGHNYPGHWHKEEITPLAEDVEVLGRFIDDSPAITLNQYGQGQALYFGTHADVAHLEDNSRLMWDVLRYVFEKNAIQPTLHLDYVNRKDKEIDGHWLTLKPEATRDADYGVVMVTNYVREDFTSFFIGGKKTVRFSLAVEKAVERITDYLSGEEVPFTQSAEKVAFEKTVSKNKVMILKVTFSGGKHD